MSLIIRPFEPDDYPVIVAIENIASRKSPRTVEEVETEDKNRSRYLFQRYVAERDGMLTGFGFYHQWGSENPPRRFYGSVYVHPLHERQGIGSALYDCLMNALMPYEPKVLATWIRENLPQGIRFLESRGFREFMRDIESQLDVGSFDPRPHWELEAKLQQLGIRVKTLSELENDPDRDRKLYTLIRTIEDRMPHSEPFPPQPFDEFRMALQEEEKPGAYFVAVRESDYIGKASFHPSGGRIYLFTALTCVLPEFRRLGVATALKAREILYARAQGYATIRTENRADNVAMLSVNKRLGFVAEPADIGFKKTF